MGSLNYEQMKIAILGAGKGGSRLLEVLSQLPGVEICGVADKNPSAPGLRRALDLNIPVSQHITDFIGNHGINLIIDVTGDPALPRIIAQHKSPEAETLTGAASKLLWHLMQHESQLQAEVSHTDKLAAIGSFAAGIAHDINNPLYLILGLAEDLMEQTDPTIIQHHARDIIDAVKRTSRICSDLTRYARRADDHGVVGVDVHAKLDDAVKIGRYALLFQDIVVQKAYGAVHATVQGNPDDLLHMFVNLITNAIQAMDGRGTLTLQTSERDAWLEVRVTDTGCGIPRDVLERIFEPFYTTKAPGKGTGLGLYNVKAILMKLEGTIAVESEVGKGTTFLLRLPIAKPVG
ncbi:MAG: sensor histidine kinase [Nitrospiraceae bacterium]